MSSIQDNLSQIRQHTGSTVKILGAAKKKSSQDVQEAIAAGIDFIGENYVQEAEEKYQGQKLSVPLHFIGHLQKNKVKKAVELFDCIQSVDSIALTQEIDKRCSEHKQPFPIFIQVNVGNEPQKSGVVPEQLLELAQEISKLENIELKGLMCIPPVEEDNEKTREHYKAMKQLFDMINENNSEKVNLTELSMGMSGDYEIAIEEGATIIRLGTTIFGERN